MAEFTFPVYRKYKNNTSYFRIESNERFIEIMRIGEKNYVMEIEAKQYPERLRIKDMIECKDGHWEEIKASEFEALYSTTSQV